jgi:hypothetical protein
MRWFLLLLLRLLVAVLLLCLSFTMAQIGLLLDI